MKFNLRSTCKRQTYLPLWLCKCNWRHFEVKRSLHQLL